MDKAVEAFARAKINNVSGSAARLLETMKMHILEALGRVPPNRGMSG